MDSNSDKLKEEVLIAVSVSLGALFFATVITLIVARYYKQIKACCLRYAPNDGTDNNNPGVVSSNKTPQGKGGVAYSKLVENRKSSSALPQKGLSSSMLLSMHSHPFIIPGGYYSQPIQPELKMDSSYSKDGAGPIPKIEISQRADSVSESPSNGSPASQRRNTYSSVSLPSNFSPFSTRKMMQFRQDSSACSSEDEDTVASTKKFISIEDMTALNLRPELYDVSRRRTVGIGNLGKVQISLQYEDNSRRKLFLFVIRIRKLQFPRPDITGIYGSVVLLPDREAIFTTKQHGMATSPVFEEKFIFASRPMNRDFESKTVLFLIHYTDRSGKDVIYGEARMPLLCRDIYSQVTTDVTLNIKPASMQSEFGDLLIQLVFNESGSLSVMIKMIKVPSSMSLENMSAIRIKSYMKKLGSRYGRKSTFVSTLVDPNQHLKTLDGECSFKVNRENFMDSDLTCAVFGKHKILGKKLNLGKVTLGFTSRDETGVAHWRTIYNSPGVAWSVWHPIYNT